MQAGKKGNFGFVLGIARENNRAELEAGGADFIVGDLGEINGIQELNELFTRFYTKKSA